LLILLSLVLGWVVPHLAEAQTIGIAERIGCTRFPVLERIFRYARDGDAEGAGALFRAQARRGRCIRFRPGDRVTVTQLGQSWHQARLHPAGRPVEYWVVVLGTRQHPVREVAEVE
jgi:hypothetical protein